MTLHTAPGAPRDPRLNESGSDAGPDGPVDDLEPTAGMVLHRVLAMSARTFLLNDMGDELEDESARIGTVAALRNAMGTDALWAQSAVEDLPRGGRRETALERIHQSRVALRRIRSNLRTYRLLLDPTWGTKLRAELTWYGNRLGAVRDLQLLRQVVTTKGPEVMETAQYALLDTILAERLEEVLADIAVERAKPRRFQLTEQMMILWDGPAFKPKAERPALDVLPGMLQRAWTDLRGAGRTARKKPSDANLHKLRIRLKDLRYGCDTLALIEGGAPRKTARAARSLQDRLGALHDAEWSIGWLTSMSLAQPGLTGPIDDLILLQEDAAKQARKGWKQELKAVEQQWRSWHT